MNSVEGFLLWLKRRYGAGDCYIETEWVYWLSSEEVRNQSEADKARTPGASRVAVMMGREGRKLRHPRRRQLGACGGDVWIVRLLTGVSQ
jgi:hypothetical protein